MDNIKNIICLLFFCMMFMSSTKEPKIKVDQLDYQHRLIFIQNRSRMLEEMFNKDYLEGRMKGDYKKFYVQMVVSLDSCAQDMKKYKVSL